MLFFWCGFLSLIVSILDLSSGYNERIYIEKQNDIIKRNMYIDYLTASATVLDNICSSGYECDNMSSLSTQLSDTLTESLSDYGYSDSITTNFCIYNSQIIVYETEYYFDISHYADSSLSSLTSLDTDVKNFCSIGDESGIAFIKELST